MSLEFLNSSMCSEQARYYLLGENFHPKKKGKENKLGLSCDQPFKLNTGELGFHLILVIA